MRFRFATGKWNHAPASPRFRISDIIERTDSHSREFQVSSFAHSDGGSLRSARLRFEAEVKTAFAAGSRSNQINFNVNLPASCSPLCLTTLFRLQILAQERGRLSFLAQEANAKHANRNARTTVLIMPDSIELRRFISDFPYISVSTLLRFLLFIATPIDISTVKSS